MDQAACQTISEASIRPTARSRPRSTSVAGRRRPARKEARRRHDSFAAWRANRRRWRSGVWSVACDDVLRARAVSRLTAAAWCAGRGRRSPACAGPSAMSGRRSTRRASTRSRLSQRAARSRESSQHAHSKRGLEALDLILDADVRRTRGRASTWTNDQPGLAIAKLCDSLRTSSGWPTWRSARGCLRDSRVELVRRVAGSSPGRPAKPGRRCWAASSGLSRGRSTRWT